MEKTVIKCLACEVTFTLKKNMYAHCRNIHKIEHLSKKPKMSLCHICGTKFANKNCLSQHMKKFHNYSINEKYTRIICPYDLCEENVFTSLKLREHLFVKHNITVELEEITFDNLREFETWKQKIEKETVSMYVLDTGTKKMCNGVLKQYYFCHRSSNYRKSRNDIRSMKWMGSNKIGKTCPSKLETTILEINGVTSVQVKYWKTHCGHAQEIERLKIDKENRAMVAEKNASKSKNRKIYESHKISELISSDEIQILEGGQSWIVNSLTNPSEKYCVTGADETCNGICLKCSDNIVKLNTCKHIHASAQAFNKLPDDNSKIFYLEDTIIGEQELIEMISQPSMKCTTPSTPGISG